MEMKGMQLLTGMERFTAVTVSASGRPEYTVIRTKHLRRKVVHGGLDKRSHATAGMEIRRQTHSLASYWIKCEHVSWYAQRHESAFHWAQTSMRKVAKGGTFHTNADVCNKFACSYA